MPASPTEELILKMARKPRLAHAVLFKHRHPDETPFFHGEMIDVWHSDEKFVETQAFRGGAKSTLAEEAIIVKALLRKRRHILVIGENERRSVDRLRSVKHELESNEFIIELFGDQRGDTWQETKIVLSNGTVIQALGRGQSLRGIKHLDARPDFCFIDDLEDEESVRTLENRDATMTWFTASLLPALEPGYQVRVAATPLDPDAFAVRLTKSKDWKTLKFPVEYIDKETGVRTATWPGRFPLEEIDRIKSSYVSLGRADVYQREYMCEAVDPATKVFVSDMMKVRNDRYRTWQAVYAMYDPARSVKATSASTGKAVWSWFGNKLVIWELSAHLWMPDEIISDLFRVDKQYNPVKIGVEEDGLNEFLLQPLRSEQIKRGHPLPLAPLKAPRGKLDFIKGLQPFFKAGEIEFAGERADFEDGINQFMSYPTGRIDAPNALAYALILRPGSPIYDDFEGEHVIEALPKLNVPFWLAVNATQQETSAVLLQVSEGVVYIHADWLREGDPGKTLLHIAQEAAMEAGTEPYRLKVVSGPQHHSGYDNVGLLATARRIPLPIRRGGDTLPGREETRKLLRVHSKGRPAIQVSSNATWTLRAFAGGFCRRLNPDGRVSDQPEDNSYRVLMEGLENFCALLNTSAVDVDKDIRYSTATDGRRYVSAMGNRG